MNWHLRQILTSLVIGITLAGMAFTAQGQSGPGKNGRPSAKRRYINLPSKNPALPFSDAVLVGDTLYLAGRLGTDPKTNQIPSDLEQEVRFLLDGFKETLAAGGMTMDKLVTVTIYCPDLTLYDKFNTIYRT